MRLLPVSSIISLFSLSSSVYLFPLVFLYDDRIVIPGVSFFIAEIMPLFGYENCFIPSILFSKAFTFEKRTRGCERKCFVTCFDIALKELNCWNVRVSQWIRRFRTIRKCHKCAPFSWLHIPHWHTWIYVNWAQFFPSIPLLPFSQWHSAKRIKYSYNEI